MSKKILKFILIGLLFCSPLWGETDNPWDKFLSFKDNQAEEPLSDLASTEIGDNLIASPQSFCATNPFATSCQNTCARGTFPGGYLWRYQDPRLSCPDTVFPFLVTDISIGLTNCGNQPCTLSFEGGIYRIGPGKDTCPDGKICRTPGELICRSELVTVILPPLMLNCTTIFLHLPDPCCVYSSYFAGVKIPGPPPKCFVNPCLDNSKDTCRGSWYWDGSASDTLNMLCDLGFPQNLCINSYGFVRDQNNCPRPKVNRGIWSITILPGPQIDQAEIKIEWYAQIFPPDPVAPPNPVEPLDVSSMLEIQLLAEPRPDPILIDIPLLFLPPNPVLTKAAGPPGDCIGATPPCVGECPYVVGTDPPECVEGPNVDCVCEHREVSTTIVGVGANAGEVAAVIEYNLNYWCVLCPAGCNLEPNVGPYYCGSCCCFQCGDPEPYFADEDYMQDDMMTVPLCVYKPGDVNADGMYNLSDIIREVNIVFKGAPKQPLMCLMDANADKMTNLTDIIYDVNHVFKGGPKPNPSGVCCK